MNEKGFPAAMGAEAAMGSSPPPSLPIQTIGDPKKVSSGTISPLVADMSNDRLLTRIEEERGIGTPPKIHTTQEEVEEEDH